MLVESTKYIISLLSIFIFFIIYFTISLILLKTSYQKPNNIWLYSLIYTLTFPLKIYLLKEYIIEKNDNNFIVKKKIMDFNINNDLNNTNLLYFIFVYLCEIILLIWGSIVISFTSYNKYNYIYILSLFNIILGALIIIFLSFTISKVIINNRNTNKRNRNNRNINNNFLDKENNIESQLVKEEYIEENNKIEIAERSIYGSDNKITEI
tara:strand:- start:576 stop:1202 length:627 start_codon:yes stop_codon:yes gene_type:complete